MKRQPKPFPKLRFKRKVNSIDDFTMDDFDLIDYESHPPLKMAMAV